MIRSFVQKCAGAANLPGPAAILSDFRARFTLLIATFMAGVLAIALVTGLCFMGRVPFSYLTRDAIELLKAPPYYGALSSLGALIWAAGAVACFFGATIMSRRSRDRAWMGFLLALGSLTTLLALDDLFMLHEVVLPRLLGVRQRFIVVGYVVLAGLFLIRHRKLIFQTEYPLLVAALGFFSVSVLSDGVQTRVDLPFHYGIEDGGKLLGILGWTVYSVRLSMGRVLDAVERRKNQSDPALTPAKPASNPLWGGAQQPGSLERRRRAESWSPGRALQSPPSAAE